MNEFSNEFKMGLVFSSAVLRDVSMSLRITLNRIIVDICCRNEIALPYSM